MTEFYVAVLEQDCEAHYFDKAVNAENYLVQNCKFPNCTLDPDSHHTTGELWNENGESVGYYYKTKTED